MKMHEFGSGAKSTVVKPRYDLIPIEAMQALAARFGYGASRHGENNWRKGAKDPEFIRDRKNHAIEHLYNYANNQTTFEDGKTTSPLEHLEAAITNLAMLCGLERMKLDASNYDREPEDADPLDIRKP